MSLSVNTSTSNNLISSSRSSFSSLSSSSTSNTNIIQNQLLREYSTLSSADKIKVKEMTKIEIKTLINKMGYSPSAAAWAIKYINEQLNKAETAAALNINNTRKSI